MDFKWIRFLIKWIINGVDWIKKTKFFAHPYL